MQITEAGLLEEKKSLEDQRERARLLIQQATGAISLIDVLIQKIREPEATDES